MVTLYQVRFVQTACIRLCLDFVHVNQWTWSDHFTTVLASRSTQVRSTTDGLVQHDAMAQGHISFTLHDDIFGKLMHAMRWKFCFAIKICNMNTVRNRFVTSIRCAQELLTSCQMQVFVRESAATSCKHCWECWLEVKKVVFVVPRFNHESCTRWRFLCPPVERVLVAD